MPKKRGKSAEIPVTVLYDYIQGPFPDKLLYNIEYLQSNLKSTITNIKNNEVQSVFS